MIISSPYVIILSADEHHELTVRAGSARAAHRDVVRATIILSAARGGSNAPIAADLGVHVHTVRKWRRRFWQHRLAGLADLPRPGRPRQFSAVQVAEVKALACELPAESGLPLAKWSCPELAAEARRVASSLRSRLPPCVVGSPPTRSNRGSTGHGSSHAIPTSPPKRLGCWTYTPAPLTEHRSGTTNTCSPPTRNPACKAVSGPIPVASPSATTTDAGGI
jgi:transposase